MKTLFAVAAFICSIAQADAQAVTASTSAPTIILVQPQALPNGHISTPIVMSDGTSFIFDGGIPNQITLTAYDPASYAITLGSTTQLRSGYVVYDLTGSGIIAAATVKLPASPVDKQLARLAMLGTFTITILTVQDANGTAVGTVGSLVGQSDALYQFQGAAWVRIGS